jgi:hypothetical protein
LYAVGVPATAVIASVSVASYVTPVASASVPHVKVYKNKALSAQEVLQNYNATKSRFGL